MIDDKLQKELRERFNPDGSLLRKHQLRMLEMLKYIDTICKENNISYWLSSGTCLGAVRHGGFIPWDDDVDIEMLRDDFEKFLKIFPENEKYALQTKKTDKYFLLPFAKVRDLNSRLDELWKNSALKYQGIFVDVFVLEESPRFAYVIFGVLSLFLQEIQSGANNRFMLWLSVQLKKILYGAIRLLTPVFNLFPNKTLNHAYGCGPGWKSRDADNIFPLTEILFEGYKFPIPKDSDSYLKKMYGNYMQLPNLNKLRIHSRDCIFYN